MRARRRPSRRAVMGGQRGGSEREPGYSTSSKAKKSPPPAYDTHRQSREHCARAHSDGDVGEHANERRGDKVRELQRAESIACLLEMWDPPALVRIEKHNKSPSSLTGTPACGAARLSAQCGIPGKTRSEMRKKRSVCCLRASSTRARRGCESGGAGGLRAAGDFIVARAAGTHPDALLKAHARTRCRCKHSRAKLPGHEKLERRASHTENVVEERAPDGPEEGAAKRIEEERAGHSPGLEENVQAGVGRGDKQRMPLASRQDSMRRLVNRRKAERGLQLSAAVCRKRGKQLNTEPDNNRE